MLGKCGEAGSEHVFPFDFSGTSTLERKYRSTCVTSVEYQIRMWFFPTRYSELERSARSATRSFSSECLLMRVMFWFLCDKVHS